MLDITIWIAQGFLALFFLAGGVPKIIGRGLERWVGFDDLPRALVVVIGVSEVAAAVGLIAPMVAGRGEWTTPLAAVGLAAVSLMASGFHLRQGEWLPTVETALLASLAATVVIGRWGEMSTAPSIPVEVLVPVIAVLVAAVIVNLIVLGRRPIEPVTEQRESSGRSMPDRKCLEPAGRPAKPFVVGDQPIYDRSSQS